MKINTLAPDTVDYLQILGHIAKPPKSLYVIGNLPKHRLPTTAIVGTRRPTSYGQEVGYRLAYDLAAQGIIIVSGLALGMDAIAHKAALDAGGTTIAVMAGGLDSIHPYSHRNLALQILKQGGALISEYPSGSTPFKQNFIERNRIVTGISDGLLVIEAAAKSGTMHTANFALGQGKPVMAVPGNVTSPMSEGCNNLIATGARLIRTASDVLEEIGYKVPAGQTALPVAENAAEAAILDLIAQGVRAGEDLQLQSQLDPTVFNQALTMLEITGKIRALGGNQWGMR